MDAVPTAKRAIIIAAMLGIGVILSAVSAKAAALLSFDEIGGDVVGTLSGSLDLSGLTPTYYASGFYANAGIRSDQGRITTHNFTDDPADKYNISGPANFGTSHDFTMPTSSTATPIHLWMHFNEFYIISSYVSGSSLGGNITFGGVTLADLGITPGDFVYSLDNGDTLTLRFNAPSPVPLPAALPLFLTVLTGMGLLKWQRHRLKA